MTKTLRTHYYFVDEAGDLTLFNKKGQTLLGKEGVSDYFMVGMAHLPDPTETHHKLEALRQELLADSYFKDVPSMQPKAQKTAVSFHANKDVAEVRREVFKLLPQFGAKVLVAVRRKSVLVQEAQTLHRYGRKLRPNDVYDDLIRRLFKNMLHKADRNEIVFAYRGSSDRKEALEKAIRQAKQTFAARWGDRGDKPTLIRSGSPPQHAGLQVVDYYLWALQRLYERGEDRFFLLLAKDFRLIMDLDDKRYKPYGTWYSDRNPLSLDKLPKK